MYTPSRVPSSNQQHLHPRLAQTVRRHLAHRPRTPVAQHTLDAFERLLAELARQPRPLVLDSFCGSGHSTAALARRHPGHLVVGVDKSAARLGRHPATGAGNYLLLQAECETLWQLLATRGIGIDHHYLLYPNPWPKAAHLQRRVHGSAGFYWLLQLGASSSSRIELRSNWQTYVEEFGVAMHLAGHPGSVARIAVASPVSLFEQKYRDSGHDLWAFTGRIGRASPAAT
ncbi:MAG: SAM-dependent methyltransferase [Halieaceae bacterium]|nr:SAM-dependent methyltransferase [Halieaceae bacterium]